MRLQVTPTKAVTRDLDGSIFIWNLPLIKEPIETTQAEEQSWILTKVKSCSKTVTCIAMDERQLLMGSIGHFNVFDYWT